MSFETNVKLMKKAFKAETDYHREQFLAKPLPHAPDAEVGLQGGIILDNDQMDAVAENLTAEDFYSPRQKIFFKAMFALWQKKLVIDPITIANEMKAQGESIDSLGGVASIANLTIGLPHFSDLTDWIKIVKDKSVVRQIIKLCSYLIEISLSEEMTAEEILNYGEAQFYQIRDKNFTSKQVNTGYTDLLKESIAEMQRRAKMENKIFGIETGYTDLDFMTGGIQKEYIILAGRPSIGKSALGFDIARQSCLKNRDLVIGIFSLEMDKKKVVNRHLAQTAMVDARRMKNGELVKSEWEKVGKAYEELAGLNMPIDDTPKVTPSYIRAKCRRWVKEFGRLDGIVIDYGGLMNGDKEYGSTQERVSANSKELASIRKEFDMFVLALEQLSRKPEERQDKRPLLSDLRDSGTLEQDADSVWMAYRDEYYHKTDSNAGKAELLIRKSREGQVGTVPLTWMSFCTHFANAAN